jgi:hypothetical protein
VGHGAGPRCVQFQHRTFLPLAHGVSRQGKSHAGIVLAQQQRYSIGEQMRRLLTLIAAKSAEEMKDQVEFLGAWG